MEIPLSVIKRYPKHTSGDTAICEGEQVQLRAYGGTSYLWLNPNNLSDIHSDRPWAKPAQTTIFPVQITQGQCFVDTLNVKVTVEITPAITLPNQYVVKSGDQVHLNPDIITGEHLSFTWAGDNSLTCYNCKTPYATPVVNTTYTVVATTPHGCAASTTTNVVLFCDRDQVFIPNTFTPNNDGLNDFFYVSAKGIREIVRMSVYDRWGELIFDKAGLAPNEPNNGWDGNYRGTPALPGIYMYFVEVICEQGVHYTYKGDIALLK